MAITSFQGHFKCVNCLQEFAFKIYRIHLTLQVQVSATYHLRHHVACVAFNSLSNYVAIDTMMQFDRKKWEVKTVSFGCNITNSSVILKIVEMITNSHWKKTWSKRHCGKKGLAAGFLGDPGQLVPTVWLIELQTCQSDSFNSLCLKCRHVQLSPCHWTISLCHQSLP